MAQLLSTRAPRWTQFKQNGEYQCPVCPTHVASTPGIKNHIRTKHRPLYDRIMRGEPVTAAHPEKKEPPIPRTRKTRAETQAVVGAATGLLEPGHVFAQLPTASEATIAILQLGQVKHLSVADLREVMEVVCKVRQLDEGSPSEETGFKADAMERRLRNSEPVNEGVH